MPSYHQRVCLFALALVQLTTLFGGLVTFSSAADSRTWCESDLVGGLDEGDTPSLNRGQIDPRFWVKAYGGASADYGHDILETNDGGYLVVGETASFTGTAWVFKINQFGDVAWQKTYGNETSVAVCALQAGSEGYLVVGNKLATPPAVWLLKLDTLGNVMWQKNYAGADMNSVAAFVQTSDGNYARG